MAGHWTGTKLSLQVQFIGQFDNRGYIMEVIYSGSDCLTSYSVSLAFI